MNKIDRYQSNVKDRYKNLDELFGSFTTGHGSLLQIIIISITLLLPTNYDWIQIIIIALLIARMYAFLKPFKWVEVLFPLLLLLLLIISMDYYRTNWHVVKILLSITTLIYSLFALAWVQSRQVEHLAKIDYENVNKQDYTEIIENMLKSKEAFGIYLRGFNSEEPLAIIDVDEIVGPVVVDYEFDNRPQSSIKRELPLGFPVYAMANQRSLDPNPVFPEVIILDHNWEEHVQRYAKYATLIIIWFERESEGIADECELICDDAELSNKTWLVYNPNIKNHGKIFDRLANSVTWVSEWNDLEVFPKPNFDKLFI
ncbi:MAG: hypothetical protein R3F48_12585 [Candidatus Zixiibacteriota bacterium]